MIERLKELAQDIEHADKAELDFLKQNFYKLHKAETDAARKAFVENGGTEEDFVPAPDPTRRLQGGDEGHQGETECADGTAGTAEGREPSERSLPSLKS